MAERGKGERYGIVHNGSAVSGLKGPDDGVFWKGYSHQEMWGMVMRSQPDALFERVGQWQTLAETLMRRNESLQKSLTDLLTTWQGPAAAAAAASQQKLLAWAQDAATRASTISTQLADYGNALVDARLRMPQPRHRQAELDFRAGEGANVQDGAVGAYKLLQLNSDYLPAEQERREAKNEAVRVMQRLEKDAVAAERAMPRFEAPPTVTAAPDPAPSGPPARPAPVTPSVPGAPQPPVTPPDLGVPTPPSTEPPGYTSTAPAAVSSTGPGTSFGPGAPDAGSRPLHDGRIGPFGGGNGPLGAGPLGAGPFRGEAGVLGERPAGAGAATRPVGASGIPGRPGVGGQVPVMPGPAGTRGDEDKEKPLADYLEGPDDVFAVGRPAYPPVLGA